MNRKRVYHDLIAYIRSHKNEFTSRDLKRILGIYGYSTTEANVMHNLFAFLQLADRRHINIKRRRVGAYTYKVYCIDNQLLQEMQNRMDFMSYRGVWLQNGLQRTDPRLGVTFTPRQENGMDMLLF